MLKVTKVLFVLIIICIFIVAFFRHSLCQILIVQAVSKATGLKLSIEDLNLNLFNNSLHMRGITLFNPPQFNNKVLGQAREILISYGPLDFLKGRLHLREVKADISEINIIRNKKGDSNISALKGASPQGKPTLDVLPAATDEKELKTSKKRHSKFIIDRLELLLEKASIIDYQAQIGEAAVIVFTTDGPFVFKNVTSLGYVFDSVSTKGGFKNLLNNSFSR